MGVHDDSSAGRRCYHSEGSEEGRNVTMLRHHMQQRESRTVPMSRRASGLASPSRYGDSGYSGLACLSSHGARSARTHIAELGRLHETQQACQQRARAMLGRDGIRSACITQSVAGASTGSLCAFFGKCGTLKGSRIAIKSRIAGPPQSSIPSVTQRIDLIHLIRRPILLPCCLGACESPADSSVRVALSRSDSVARLFVSP